MGEISATKHKIDNLIGIHSRDGYHTAALLTPDDLSEIKDRLTTAQTQRDAALAERDELQDQLNDALRKQVDGEIELSAALARAERLEKALEGLDGDVAAIRFQVAEKAAFGVAPATFGDDAPYAIGWRHACDAISIEIRAALSSTASTNEA